MAWSTPRTWVTDEVVTAALVNAHLRDNMEILETPRDSSGRVEGLTSAELADLSPANLTGLATRLTGSDYTQRNRFDQGEGTRVVVPVGTDLWTGTKGVDAAGVWVEGDYLHHIASDVTTEWRYLGTFVGTPAGATVGSVWVEGDDLHYIDADGDERACESAGATQHSDSNALGGSAWIETYLHWVRESGTLEQPGHSDITHSDHTDHNDHDDHDDNGAHSDTDTHDDTTHSPHDDHDDHDDFDDLVASEPVHDDHDDHGDHTDYTDHDDHSDSGPHDDHDDHNDNTPHNDITADNRPVVV